MSVSSPLSFSSVELDTPVKLGDTTVGTYLDMGGRGGPEIEWLKRGVTVIKHGRLGKPKQKILTYVERSCQLEWTAVNKYNPLNACLPMTLMTSPVRKTPHTSALSMVTITAIVGGSDTEAYRRAKHKHPDRCVTVVAYDRSLNMTLRNEDEATRMRKALRDIVDHLGIRTVKFS